MLGAYTSIGLAYGGLYGMLHAEHTGAQKNMILFDVYIDCFYSSLYLVIYLLRIHCIILSGCHHNYIFEYSNDLYYPVKLVNLNSLYHLYYLL